ncbi:MAG: CsoS2 family carboxysome shell protein [Rhodocyclaceae bacterium]|nr:CsoS2 family carboxysome shell protein [Rhodocyclaceae bacterium]MDZ4214046.1 CsoS2 family carboxysome shell protein [Rhodocyclaceae bacterium]
MTLAKTAVQTFPGDAVASVTLSGRELAMQRRQAMARLGKVGAGRTAASSTATAQLRQTVQRAPAAAVAQSAPASAPAPTPNPARARREALSRMGKAALPASAQQQEAARRAARQAEQQAHAQSMPASAITTETLAVQPAAMSEASTSVTPAPAMAMPLARPPAQASGRAMAQARRAVLAQEGKSGLKRVAQATRIAAVMPEQNWQAAISQGATGRQVAMQRRIVQSLVGRAGESSAPATKRPTGRVRPTVAKGEAPAKVEEGHTLGGQRLTGMLLEGSKSTLASGKSVTGMEAGVSRAVTGTEYLGAEHYARHNQPKPPRAPQKVIISQSDKGKTLTGTPVGRSAKVTGDESGADRKLTGTAYTAAADGSQAPAKVAVTHTAQGKTVTGTPVGRATKVTGDDRGNCQRVSGTEYLSAEQFQTECNTPLTAAVPKVSVMSSRAEQSVSGTAVGRSSKVTGDEPGACRPVTGSQYYNTRDFADLCATPSPRRSGSVMSTASPRETRDEGRAFPKASGDMTDEAVVVTAHPFGLDRRLAAQIAPASTVTTAVIPAYAVTGDRPGAGGNALTGDHRGACLPVSGSPYIGEDNASACSPSSATPSARFVARTRSWQDAEDAQRPEPPLDFSIRTPAREAQESGANTVTGGDMGSQRITGPANKASGLITGTPDFRHQRVQHAPSAAATTDVVTTAQHLTGEGSQAGTRVTGDAWQEQRRVTGTEGASAQARNPSLRGQSRGTGMNAQQFREIERPPVPESRITGSSGSTSKGAMVTVSGGARA